MFIAVFTSKCSYLVLVLRNLKNFEAFVSDHSANSEIAEKIKRFRIFIRGFIGYILLFASLIVALYFWKQYGLHIEYFWNGLKSLAIFAFASFAIKWNSVYIDSIPLDIAVREIRARDESPNEIEVDEEPRQKRKYAKSGLPEEQLDLLHDKLSSIVETEKPYLACELSLASLADRLGIHPNHLSQLINQRFNQSFSSFINHYRVEHAKVLLSGDNISMNILEIGMESGFNSKANFNRVFAKSTSQTPSEFRKNAKNADRK